MIVRYRSLFALLAGLGMASQLPAEEPARLQVDAGAIPAVRPAVPADQQLADDVASHLRQGGQLRHYRIDVSVRNGTVVLTGLVSDPSQREEAVRIAHGVPGVERVQDSLTLQALATITQTQAQAPDRPVPEPPALPRQGGMTSGPVQEPTPVFAAPAPSAYDLNPPHMPPYAWPTYAPYNNYSRVAYPLLYPYNAWPFVGPCYPFPQIPLGWRSVKLTWEDGYWWYSRHSTSHDWWRLRYW